MKIYSWGPNSKGQQSSGDYEDYCLPNCISLSFNIVEIKSIICGLTYSYVITVDGQIYVCGNNGKGQISLGQVDTVSKFVPLPDICGLRVVSVATGWDFSVLITDTGRLYSCGDNRHYQLGIDNSSVQMSSKFKSLDLPAMIAVKAGMWHVVALSVDNDIWTWGYNHKAQLGFSKTKSGFLPSCRDVGNKEKTKFIIAGAYFSGLMTYSGSLIMWGDNQYGQCGTSDKGEVESLLVEPRRMLSALTDLVQLDCGWTHCLARDGRGICYSWGQNTYCQLGRSLTDGKDCDPIPRPIDYFSDLGVKIKEISCGSQHNLAVDTNSTLWSWGWNDHGILGLGDFIDRIDPHKVSILPPSVQLISRGGSHSFVLVS